MRLTTIGADTLARINRGEIITDIGQIDQPTRRLLKRFLDRGYVCRGVDYAFPKEKTCWAGVDYWDVHDHYSSLPYGTSVPTNYKFREI